MNAAATLGGAIRDLHKALCGAGLADGALLGEGEVKGENRTIFWPNRVTDPEALRKRTFAVVTVQALEPSAEGDDDSGATVTAYVDFHTLASPDDPAFLAEVERVEAKLREEGWGAGLDLPFGYDQTSQRHQLTLSAEKTYL